MKPSHLPPLLLMLLFLCPGCLVPYTPPADDDDTADDDDSADDDDDSADDDDDSADDDDDDSADDDDSTPPGRCDEFFSKPKQSEEFVVYHLDEIMNKKVVLEKQIDPLGAGFVWSTVVADFTGDGTLDILAERSEEWPAHVFVDLFEGQCDNQFLESELPPSSGLDLSGIGVDIITAADLDNDGDSDLIGWTWDQGIGAVWLNDGDGRTWSSVPGPSSSPAAPFSLMWWDLTTSSRVSVASPPVDLTGDGRIDLLECANWLAGPTECVIHEGLGDGTFLIGAQFSVDQVVNSMAVADIDNDGLLEFFGGLDDDGDAGQMWLWESDGLGSYPTGAGVEFVDLNPWDEEGENHPGYGWVYPWYSGKAAPDLIGLSLFEWGSPTMRITHLSNDGAGNFSPEVLQNSWHSTGTNNMMQDFVGTAPPPSAP